MARLAVARSCASDCGVDSLDPCLRGNAFLAPHQALVSALAAVLVRVRFAVAGFGACRFPRRGQRRGAKNADYVRQSLQGSNLTAEKREEVFRLAEIGIAIHLALICLTFAGRGARSWR